MKNLTTYQRPHNTVPTTHTLNGAPQEGTAPELAYLLSGTGRQITAVEELVRVGDLEWEGFFTLPADAGSDTAGETFQFIFSALDDLDNESDIITCGNLFQVFQGELPPLDVPADLEGTALSGGRIKLAWKEVEGAAGYQLYRKTPIESALLEYIRVDSAVEFIDQTSVDGIHTYSVASIREEADLQAVSGMSASVSVNSDSTAPGVPTGLGLELVSNGMKAAWTAPAYTESITYNLYREDAASITSVTGLTPLIKGIPQTLVVDPNPAAEGRAYAVTAVDAAGNESAPLASVYINPGLLPVSGITVLQSGAYPPDLTWTHASSASITGYDIYENGDADKLLS